MFDNILKFDFIYINESIGIISSIVLVEENIRLRLNKF